MPAAEKMLGVNATCLRWARETSGQTLEEAAKRLHKRPEALEKWERGDDWPTYVQLVRLGEIYRRPTAMFFFPSPPEEEPVEQEFRLIPGFHPRDFGSDVIFGIREMRTLQIALRELTDNANPADSRLVELVKPARDESPADLARRVRTLLDVPVKTQLSWKSDEQAFAAWRDAVERFGIFVFKRTFNGDGVSGFCLADPVFPVVCLNNSNTFGRQTFTLFHEVCHLLLGTGGVTLNDDSYVGALPSRAQETERYCDLFATELLVPELDIVERLPAEMTEAIDALARLYRVSKQLIVRRLLDVQAIDETTYSRLMANLGRRYRRVQDGEGGGDYYATQVAYLGRNFLRLAFNKLAAGRVTADDLATSLRMKARNLPRLEEQFYSSYREPST
jgi:Zn-dependent peptidase ImmA (M78 family)